jgi:hypothetical protein
VVYNAHRSDHCGGCTYHICLQCCAFVLAMNPCCSSLGRDAELSEQLCCQYIGAVVACGVEPDVRGCSAYPTRGALLACTVHAGWVHGVYVQRTATNAAADLVWHRQQNHGKGQRLSLGCQKGAPHPGSLNRTLMGGECAAVLLGCVSAHGEVWNEDVVQSTVR